MSMDFFRNGCCLFKPDSIAFLRLQRGLDAGSEPGMTVCLDYQPGLFFSVTPDSFLSVIPDKRSAIRNPVLVGLLFQGFC